MSNPDIATRLETVRLQIRAAALAAGRDAASVRLVAVSKTVAEEAVRCALAAGQRDFGENQVQELCRKAALLPSDCTWHLIGHLQGNKVRQAVRLAAWIHTVDSVALLERIERLAAAEGRRPNVLLQVNISGETGKFGAAPEAVEAILGRALTCTHLTCCGLMTMAPFGATEVQLRQVFGGLRRCRDHLQNRCGAVLPELSMGMSGDFASAIREGATLVRLGTAIFGPRT